ncbi:nuclear transport factor 2 family protein [Hoyosella sp. YIM 151337]|uniref:nuclear transport factor 2 family protein n=1 Tax=Hoyosella sp. YIM 151337 TaxID=2992742 RepID=UPI002235A178|nr:nuclear transport factor 2 family protein [Hoyosella sp. YIM 151337]MCW4354684.1 nuclear transport factor 2 family protein [Hoyosella sp. YIM 151337]
MTQTESTIETALHERLRRLEATEEIRRLKHRYAEICDNGYKGDDFAELFTPDGVWVSNTFGTVRGRRELSAFISQIGEQHFTWAMHYMNCLNIDLSADCTRAHGTWQLLQLATQRDARGAVPILAAATYHDELIHDGTRWKFDKVTAQFHQVVDIRHGWTDPPLEGPG